MQKGMRGCILDQYEVVHYEDSLGSMGGHSGVQVIVFGVCMVHGLDICFLSLPS
jgi:hypothetical protein